MNKKDMKKIDKFIGIENIVSVYFGSGSKFKVENFRDTMCTAVARVFFDKKIIVFDNKHRQLCSGADYFFNLSKISTKEAVKIYVKDEQVFCNEKICRNFLECLPKFPKELRNKNIVIKPFELKDDPQVILMLLNTAQAGRVLGILNYAKYENIIINSSQPTCISLFAPLVTKKAHINFIDYYDRYYQGKVNGKNIWSDNKLIVSLGYADFAVMLDNFEKSPHGSYKPKIYAQKVDPIG